jgi:hypothetical protein
MSDNATDESQMSSGFTDVSTETPTRVAAEPAAQQVTQAEATPAAPAIDPMKEIMDRLDKFQASHDKLAGNLGRLQQSQEEVRANLAAAQAATKSVQDAPTNAQVKEAMSDPEEWARLKASYPEWATATEKLIDARLAHVGGKAVDQAEIDRIVADRVAGQTAAVRTEMIDSHLDSIVDGDWREVVNSEAFGKWLEVQPDSVKALDSPRMADAAKMLRLYEASKKPVPAAQPAAPAPSARQKRLEAAVVPKGSGGHNSAPNEKDEMSSGFYGK